jgi:hypothetical protein
MVWTQLPCGNFIIFRLNTKQLLASTHALLSAAILLVASGCLHGIIRFKDVSIPVTDSRLCGFLAAAEAPYQFEHSAPCTCSLSFHKLLMTDDECLTV